MLRHRFKFWKVLRFLFICFALVCIVLTIFENSMVYPAPKYPTGDSFQATELALWQAEAHGAEDVQFESQDGTRLHGWYWSRPSPRGFMLYCHGNGDCVAYLGDYLQEISRRHNLSVLVFDYRGYGRSEGSPSETGLLQDAAAAQKWLAERAGINRSDVILMGRSLGGAVCVDLAANAGARGLILQNTFTSLPDVAAKIYWFLPVRMLMRNQYRSIDKITRYRGPVLQSHGTVDSIVPIENAQQLHAAIPGAKQFFIHPGGDHNDPESVGYSEALEQFLCSLA